MTEDTGTVELPVWCQGAVGMAQHWVRNPERIVEAGFPQVGRELYTISRALAFLAASVAGQPPGEADET